MISTTPYIMQWCSLLAKCNATLVYITGASSSVSGDQPSSGPQLLVAHAPPQADHLLPAPARGMSP